MKPTISVFGSSFPRQGEKAYNDAYTLGSILARNGFNICTGGYQGIMDAASKGASENGTEAIGITVKSWKSVKSCFLTKVIECDSLFERLSKLIEIGNGFAVLPGGTGTLLELSAVWELMSKNLMAHKPAACLSLMWKQIIEVIEHNNPAECRTGGLIKYFDGIEDMADYLIGELSF